MVIRSGSNEKIKQLRKLVKSSKERMEKGLYIVEGIRMFREIPASLFVEAYVSEGALEKYEVDVSLELLELRDCHVLSDSVFQTISDTKSPQGILAVVRMRTYTFEDICGCASDADECPFILAAERLQDPGNLGTIIRSAEAAGVTGIMLSNDCADIYNPKTVRSTMGSLFRMPVYVSENLKEDINLLHKSNIKIYGAHLKGESMYEADFTKPSAILIGNEGNGLSEDIAAAADELIYIPMKGGVESLNAAVSASVICYEVMRQRF